MMHANAKTQENNYILNKGKNNIKKIILII